MVMAGTPLSTDFRAERLHRHPIVHGGLAGLEGEIGANINGPSLIRVPHWIESPLGRYYLYFAHHGGHYIRMAYGDSLMGNPCSTSWTRPTGSSVPLARLFEDI